MGTDGYGADAVSGARLVAELIQRRRDATNLDSMTAIFNDGAFLEMQDAFHKIAGVDAWSLWIVWGLLISPLR